MNTLKTKWCWKSGKKLADIQKANGIVYDLKQTENE